MENNVDKYKKLVDDLFESAEKSVQKNPKPTHYLSDAETGQDTAEFCKQKAIEEMEEVRQAFVDFQQKIQDLAITDYLAGQIQDFAQYAVNIGDLVEQEFDESQLDPTRASKYASLKKLRAQIYSSIYNKYKKK